ncbi:hypothetical protein B840_00465 [Corynebacterium marinum DSM 44953]|uniref:AMIN-like domain-containing protein n=2 Tax=Corynebacterium marinum TaxID=349751 RepID=A0A0B6TID5_9CORY|nr:hypothetical protein B840_00465 [Corynebacterium marinum DSM 44953]
MYNAPTRAYRGYMRHHTKFRNVRTAAALIFVGALTLSACTENSDNGADPPTQTTTTATATSPATTTTGTVTATPSTSPTGNSPGTTSSSPTSTPPATRPLGSPDNAAKSQDPSGMAQLDVTNVRVGRHPDFDRVVLDLTGEGTPGWRADFNTDPRQDGSGFPVEYEGATSIDLWVTGLAMPEPVDGEYHVIGTVPGAGGVVTEVVSGGWFEGQTQFVIGLTGERPYSIQMIDNPKRLVVDILHEPGAAPEVNALGSPNLQDKTQDSGPPHRRAVTNVRIGAHDGFDRVVFDTVGEGTVGWYTSYTTDPIMPEFGEPVDYEGAIALDVNLTGVYLPSEIGEAYPPIGTTPGAGGVVVEVVESLSYHQQSQFIIGLTEKLPYSIQILENPQRVVVDILHE